MNTVPTTTLHRSNASESPVSTAYSVKAHSINLQPLRTTMLRKAMCKSAATLAFGVAVLGLASTHAPAQAQNAVTNNIIININGSTVDADPAPILRSGSVLVPLRGVLENLGARVRYVAEEKRIDVTQGGRIVVLRVGEQTATTTEKTVTLSAPPQVFEGRAFVPLRSLAELFGYNVQWVAQSRTVAISNEAGPRSFTDHRVALRESGPLGVTINFHDATIAEVGALLDAAKSAGASLIKTRFDWNSLEPQKGAAFQWPIYDRVVREARNRGLVVVGVLGNSAKWASVFSRSNDENEWRNGAPRDAELKSWENYVRRVVGRYGKDVHAWQVWERPSADKFRGGRVAYRSVVRLASTAARGADPKVIIFAGEPGGVDLEYIQTLNANGIAGITEGLSLYPLAEFQPGAAAAPEEFLRPFSTLRSDATLRGAGARDFWVGGLAWPVLGDSASTVQVQTADNSGDTANIEGIASGTDSDTRDRLLRYFTPAAQADYLMKASALSLAAGAPKVFWSRLRDDDAYERVEPMNPEWGSGLLRRDLAPRPSYSAFQTLSQQVKGKPYAGALVNGPQTVALLFDNGVEGSVAVWSTHGATRVVLKMGGEDPAVPGSLFISTRPDTQVLDSAGNVIAGAEVSFDLSTRPVWSTNIGYETRNAVKNSAATGPLQLQPQPVEYSTENGVSATFADVPGAERGLLWRKFSNFRSEAQKMTKVNDSESGLTTEISRDILNPAAGRFFIFMDVDDQYMYFNRSTPIRVTVRVRRPAVESGSLINATAGFSIQYATSGGTKFTNWQVVEQGEGWAEYTFDIPDALLANRGGYDLMINTFGSKRNLVFGGASVQRVG